MAAGIGGTLREARARRGIDLVEVEAETKIRVRYLRALENEEWDVLPGGAYTRSFIRTYATFLGLDGERLADDYRRAHEDPLGERYPRAEPVAAGGPPRRGGGGARFSRGAVAVLLAVGLVVVLIGLSFVDDGGEDRPPARAPEQPQGQQDGSRPGKQREGRPDRVSLRLTTAAEVWVCLLDAKGEELIDGQILGPGAEEGPFRSASFTVAFGNGEVEMTVNGEQAELERTPNPVGYEIAGDGAVRPLDEGERPTCT